MRGVPKKYPTTKEIFSSEDWEIISVKIDKYRCAVYEAVHKDGTSIQSVCGLGWFDILNKKHNKFNIKNIEIAYD